MPHLLASVLFFTILWCILVYIFTELKIRLNMCVQKETITLQPCSLNAKTKQNKTPMLTKDKSLHLRGYEHEEYRELF